MFDFGEKSFIGVDIGTATIKVAEVKIKNKKPALSNYAVIKIPTKKNIVGKPLSEKFLAELLKKLLRDGKISKGIFFFSVQSFGALLTLVNLPQIPDQDLEQAIQFEAHKYIPTSLDQVSLSWAVVNDHESKDSSQKQEGEQILLVAVPNSRLERYENIAQMAGLKIEAMEIESFSLARALVGKDNGKFMIVDIGSRVCNIILVEKGDIQVSRNIDAGGKDITKAISVGLSVDKDRAEKLKTSKRDFLGSESIVKFSCLDLILEEIKRVLVSNYKKDEITGVIDGIILSGGTANLIGLEKYFSDKTGIKTRIGDPFGRIACDNISEEKLKKIGSQFSVAFGLALKSLEENSF